MKISIALVVILALLGSTAPASQQSIATNSGKSVLIGILDKSKKEVFDSKFLPWIQNQLQTCANCEVKNLNVYDEKGDWQLGASMEKLAQEGAGLSFLFVTWNEKLNDSNQILLTTLKKFSTEGLLIVGSAGQPLSDEASAPLSRTFLGQVPDAIIIGELGDKDRLLANSYYGPEMLTAVRPPRDLLGQGYSPAVFATRLAVNFSKRKTSSDWLAHIKSKKASNRKIWLALDDILR